MNAIIHINDVSCQLLEIGQYRTALGYFNKGLSCVQKGDIVQTEELAADIQERSSNSIRRMHYDQSLEKQHQSFRNHDNNGVKEPTSTVKSVTSGDVDEDAIEYIPMPTAVTKQQLTVGCDSDTVTTNNRSTTDCHTKTPTNGCQQSLALDHCYGAGFICRKPLRLSDDYLASPTIDSESVITSTLIYNIALSHHLIALQQLDAHRRRQQQNLTKNCFPQRIQKRLHGCIKLYELSFRIHARKAKTATEEETNITSRSLSAVTEARQAPPSSRTNLLNEMNFALGLINNSCHVFELLGLVDKARRFCNHMLSSVMMMVDAGEVGTITELDGLLQNAQRLIMNGNFHAAAA